ncbi:myb-related transcription factor, partner of profilin-like [Rhinatrema bivittatum]|uniref:myb-related transcription factor, partner of profilin-like n=1 Tax=Rhinatrema bivittatum TaxID=194408 RepID=UPI0011294682|nr:myb-related transcription factor, partner of profilin-like [Rhinatrema bivittatum]
MAQAHPVLLRKPNFLPAEIDMLVEHVMRHRDLLYGTQSRTVGAYRKEQIWRRIRPAVNSVFHHNRSIAELMHKWRDIRRLVKRKQARRLAEGERSHITFSASEQLILGTISEAAVGGVGQLDTMRRGGQQGEPDDEQPGPAPRPQRLYRRVRVVRDSSEEEEGEARQQMEQPEEEEEQQRQGEEPEDPLAESEPDRQQDSSASDHPEPQADPYTGQAERLVQQGAGILDAISGLSEVVQEEGSALRLTVREGYERLEGRLQDLCRATEQQTEVWRELLQRMPPVQPPPPVAPRPFMPYPQAYLPPYPWMPPARAEAPGVVPPPVPPAPQPLAGYQWMAPPPPPAVPPPPLPPRAEELLPLAIPSCSHAPDVPQAPLPSEGSVRSGRSPLRRSTRVGQSRLSEARRRGRPKK